MPCTSYAPLSDQIVRGRFDRTNCSTGMQYMVSAANITKGSALCGIGRAPGQHFGGRYPKGETCFSSTSSVGLSAASTFERHLMLEAWISAVACLMAGRLRSVTPKDVNSRRLPRSLFFNIEVFTRIGGLPDGR
jgi:hypothetical protein